ncbi:MAG: hypothetical protein ABI690_36040 [Chloroflexota bacterium]
MDAQNLSNLHYAYSYLVRHWHAESEKYAGGDALFTALDNGWDIDENVSFEEHWSAGAQCVVVFYFQLKRGGESMTMPVITNPFVRRVLNDMEAKLIPTKEPKKVKRA